MRWGFVSLLLVLTAVLSILIQTARAQTEPTPVDAGPFELVVTGAVVGATFGEPLNWGANEDGRLFLLVTIVASNTSNDEQNLNSNEFRIVSGNGFVPADDNLSKRPEPLEVPAMGDVIGDDLASGSSKTYILGWRLAPEITSYVLDITYGDGAQIDLSPFIEQGLQPSQIVPTATTAPTATITPTATTAPTATNAPTATIAPTSTLIPPTPTIDVNAVSMVSPDTQAGRLAGTGLAWIQLPEDDSSSLDVLVVGGGRDGTWGAVVLNGTDDLLMGVTLTAEVDGRDLGLSNRTFPNLIDPGDMALVVSSGAAARATPAAEGTPSSATTPQEREATPGFQPIDGLVTAEVVDELTADSDARDELDSVDVEVVAASVLQGPDSAIIVTIRNMTDDTITGPTVGAVCFDSDGFITGSLSADLSSTYPTVANDETLTATIPLGSLECETVVAGATARSYDAPDPTSTLAPTSTVVPPTETPAPTIAATTTQSATNTPQATATRSATNTPRATVTPNDDRITNQERTYIDALNEDQETLYQSVRDAGALFGLLEDDPTLILDNSWLIGLAAQLVVWDQTYIDAQALRPSDRQQPLQDVWLDISSGVAESIPDVTAFIDDADVAAGNRFIATIQSTNEQIPVLQDLVRDFEADPSSFGDTGSPSTGSGDENEIRSPVADCSAFLDFQEAQEYFSDHPDEQTVIDPDFDGFACEIYFGVDTSSLPAPNDDGSSNSDSGSIIGSGSNGDASSNGGGNAVASYDLHDETESSVSGRNRYRLEIIMNPNESDAALQAGIADAVRDAFRAHPDAEVITVFVWASVEDIENDLIIGRAFASSDGGGYGGDGEGLLGPDQEGEIQIEIRSFTDPIESTADL